jgi:hypothetical protein
MRHAIALATRNIFIGMGLVAMGILLVLAMVPRKFPSASRPPEN